MEPWTQRSVFVTGASGLLGSWLCEELLARSAHVTCLLRDWVPAARFTQEDLFARVNVVRGDLEDHALLLRALNEYEVDTVFHLGAQTIVGTAARSPLSTFESNVRGTWNLLEACRLCPETIERVIVASSDKAYGDQGDEAYRESAPLQGRFPYDASKSCADLIALSYFHSYRVPVAITRCGNLFGGGDLNYNRLVPGTIRSALRGEAPVIRSDGQFVRDYFYVRDAVEAYLTLADLMPRDDFSSGEPLTVIEVVERILSLCDRESLRPEILNQASREIPKQTLDCTKARKVLTWSPRFSLDAALRETIDWYRPQIA